MPGRVCKEIICSGKKIAREQLTINELLQTALEAGMNEIAPEEMEQVEQKIADCYARQTQANSEVAELAEYYAEKFLT